MVPGYATKSGLVEDCDNLLRAAYHWDTNTHNARRGLNWADTSSIYTWEGVTVDQDLQRVTGLDLNSNPRSLKLRGTDSARTGKPVGTPVARPFVELSFQGYPVQHLDSHRAQKPETRCEQSHRLHSG